MTAFCHPLYFDIYFRDSHHHNEFIESLSNSSFTNRFLSEGNIVSICISHLSCALRASLNSYKRSTLSKSFKDLVIYFCEGA